LSICGADFKIKRNRSTNFGWEVFDLWLWKFGIAVGWAAWREAG
jgi:hypothetical protein